ncbi:MAG TPA: PQQ-binding-like beta-propeller repeat protein [Acidobacteriota bacterium]
MAAWPEAAAVQDSAAWPQWRGAERDGAGDASTLPSELPAELTPGWRVDVGEGHSSPVVIGGTVFLHSREGEQEVVHALSLADGAELWSQSYAAPYTMNPAARSHGPGPKSTPVYADGRLFTFGITEVLSAFDAASGELSWRHEFSDRYPETAPIYGSAMSPIRVGDTIVAHIGWDQAGALTAFDAASGEVRWANDEFTPGYASPVLVEVAGARLLVTQTDRHIVAFDAASGATRWSMPFTTSFQQNSVTPLDAGNGRLVLSGLDLDLFALRLSPPAVPSGAPQAATMALAGAPLGGEGWRPDPEAPSGSATQDGSWSSSELWRNTTLPLYMSSPVLVGDRLFGMSHRRAGQFFCVDVATGEPIWTSRGREGENAAIVALGNRVAFLTDEARLVIVAADAAAYEPLAEYEVASTPTWAHPVFTSRGVLIKDLETLALWNF